MGIYAPAVCQNVAWEELDYCLVGASSSDSFPPPPGALSDPRRLSGDKSMVSHLLLWQNKMLWDNTWASPSRWATFCPCPDSKSRANGNQGSFLWRTLNSFLWEAVLISSRPLTMFPLPFCFLSWASVLVLPGAFLLLFELLESDLRRRCHDSLLLSSPIHVLPRNVSGKTLEPPFSIYPKVLSI